MILIGYDENEKEKIINEYCIENGIKKVFVFVPDEFKVEYHLSNIEYIPYTEIIMYRTFYRLLEVINNDTLLVFNECMRTQNRSDLTYNCAHHYCNKTQHKIVFEYFPFIEDKADFMILLDFINKGKYKGKGFDWSMLNEEKILVKRKEFIVETRDYYPTEKELLQYQQYKEALFNNLGNSDPDTVPRKLHEWVGSFKKRFINPFKKYVARNKRFKLENIKTYKEIKYGEQNEYIVIDFPHRRIDFNDFLKKTRQNKITFLNSNFKVDLYYLNELKKWIERLGEFYDKASVS